MTELINKHVMANVYYYLADHNDDNKMQYLKKAVEYGKYKAIIPLARYCSDIGKAIEYEEKYNMDECMTMKKIEDFGIEEEEEDNTKPSKCIFQSKCYCKTERKWYVSQWCTIEKIQLF